MIEKPQNFDTVFRYIVVVSQRAEQLVNGAKHRSESRHLKPTLIAKDDVDQGLVQWRILTQEELDAQRQAIVEQFRAEVGGDAAVLEAPRPIPDVLPTAIPFSSVDDDDERVEEDGDDELDRLQRLLGLAGRKRAVDDEEAADEDGEESEDGEEAAADDLDTDLDEGELDLDDESDGDESDDEDEDE